MQLFFRYYLELKLIRMMRQYSIIFLFLFTTTLALAQPSNDECDNPILLTDVISWCSSAGAFTNVGATDSGYGPASCMTNGNNDVWFSFIAVAPDITITINGNIANSPGGTLNNPEISLYEGVCGGTINELECETDNLGINILELYKGGLTVGQTYFIRVDGRSNNVGTFQLCLNNYNPPVEPGSDCNTRAFLCDKSSFSVQSVTGAGSNPDELAGSCLGGLGGPSESNSTWFAWTCGVSGTLTFTLTPTNPTDDLDFVVYELPNGVTNCSGKIVRRCMAAGDFNFPSTCMGPTGLNNTASDVTEDPGCGGGNDNWLAALDMVAGTSYALAINNFTSTGNGFSIDWGGTGEFEGPDAQFSISDPDNSICIGDNVIISDASSTNLGTIIGHSWNFGVGSIPQTASGIGPHNVTFNSLGTKSVVLTVENSLGCIVTKIVDIEVNPCCETENAMIINSDITPVECYDNPVGAIDLDVNSSFPIISYNWSNGASTEDINNLTGGDYGVTITNQFCEKQLVLTVPSPPPFEFDTIMTLATCNGGTNGTLTLNVSGGVPPYEWNWYDGNGFTSNNQITNLPIGLYNVTVRDANDCLSDHVLEVKELELDLDPSVEAVIPPSCFGFNDGRIELIVGNGTPPYQFDWNDGLGYVSQNSIENIASGTFTIDILDANVCKGQFTFTVTPPPPLAVSLDSLDVSCFGEADGSIVPLVTGGVGGYQYNWSDNQTDSIAIGLIAGTYTVTILDANGCVITDSTEVIQPPELSIIGIDVVDVVCYGDSTGVFTVHGYGGNPPYLYSVDGENFQSDSILTGVFAGTYDVTILDGLGCTASQTAIISQPLELIANAGPDLEVNLGYSIEIQGSRLPQFKPVTIEWSPVDSLSCTDCFTPIANPSVTTTYYMTITDEFGCTDIDSMTIVVDPERPIYIPNAFSPNSDGYNDIFRAYSGPAARKMKRMLIFDRWGSLVYQGEDLLIHGSMDQGWDGYFENQKMNPGVYAYLIEIEFVDNFIGLYKGDITLLR